MKYPLFLSCLFTASLFGAEFLTSRDAPNIKFPLLYLKVLEEKFQNLSNTNQKLKQEITESLSLAMKFSPQISKKCKINQPEKTYILSQENFSKLFKQDEDSILYTLFHCLLKSQKPNQFFNIKDSDFIKDFRNKIIERYKKEYGNNILRETPDIEEGTKEFHNAILQTYLHEKKVLEKVTLYVLLECYDIKESKFKNKSVFSVFSEILKDFPYMAKKFSQENILKWIDSTIEIIEQKSSKQKKLNEELYIIPETCVKLANASLQKVEGDPNKSDSPNSYQFNNRYEKGLVNDPLALLILLQTYRGSIQEDKNLKANSLMLSLSYNNKKNVDINLDDIPEHPKAFSIVRDLLEKLEDMISAYVISNEITLQQNNSRRLGNYNSKRFRK